MSLLNGIAGFGSGVGAVAGDAAGEQLRLEMQRSLLNNAPPAATAAPAAPVAGDAVPATPVAAPTEAAPAKGGAVNVPPDLLPIYQAAAKRTGIPVDVLIAQGRQESGFDPNVVSSTGGIGLHQIQPSTARDPGYGIKPVDPAALKDPAVNINFAADYLRAMAAPRIDFNNPATVDRALAGYNGGGDPNYVANVRRYMKAA